MANEQARPGPYTDVSLTRRNVTNPTAVPQGPARSGSHTQGNIRRFYAEDQVQEVDSTPTNDVDPPPHSPNHWAFGRDYYKNNGMVGQDFMRNQNT